MEMDSTKRMISLWSSTTEGFVFDDFGDGDGFDETDDLFVVVDY